MSGDECDRYECTNVAIYEYRNRHANPKPGVNRTYEFCAECLDSLRPDTDARFWVENNHAKRIA